MSTKLNDLFLFTAAVAGQAVQRYKKLKTRSKTARKRITHELLHKSRKA